jgi:hypothetical protein
MLGGFARGRGPSKTSLFALLLVTVAAVVAACGSNGSGSNFNGSHDAGGAADGVAGDGTFPGFGDGGGDGSGFNTFQSLFFAPNTATISLTPTVATGTATFTLMATRSDGSSVQVQATSLQFDRPDLATMTPGEPVSLAASGTSAGVGTLHAIYGGLSATAQLTVSIQNVVVGAGVPPAAVTALGASGLPADPSVTSLLYPYDKTVFALGLASPLVMWTAPNAADVYRLHYQEQNYTYDGYFLVAQPAQISADQTSWDHLTASNGGDPLQLQLSRWDATTQTAYVSAAQSWTIVPASLQGAIYYWTVSDNGHMSRIYPGTGSTPEILNGGTCMGCHAVSADGSTLVASVENEGSTDSSDARAWVSYTLPAMTVRDEPHLFGGNVAVTPDGKNTVFGYLPMHLGDTTTGMEIPNSGIETYPLDPGMLTLAHPAFSPDGKHLATVQSNNVWYEWTVGKLVLFDYDQAAQTFTNPLKLADGSTFAAPEQAVAYPSFAPDSSALVFHVADHAGGCHDACSAATVDTGALWIQSTTGSAPVRLTTLTDSAPNPADHDLSFEPTFNPIQRGGYNWVVFTSMRTWGNQITGAPNCGQKRLWVAAIDAKSGAPDPSHPPFFLQGQELDTMNMRGFWALAACTPTQGGGACTQGFQCCSGFCDMGTCVDTGTLSCQGIGSACTQTSDCCNSSVVSCQAGKCATTVQ